MRGIKGTARTCRLCERIAKARGLCNKHYGRWQRTGIAEATIRNTSGIIGDDDARFWFFVNRGEPHECWLWMGGKRPSGYGELGVKGRMVAAHRFSYELNVGPIPQGYEVDHVWKRGCRNTLCVNPAHLEAVTPLENLRRIADRHEACPQGHPYNAENVYWRPDGQSGRDCLTCRRERAKDRMRRIRQANVAAGLTTKGTPRKT